MCISDSKLFDIALKHRKDPLISEMAEDLKRSRENVRHLVRRIEELESQLEYCGCDH